VVAKVALQIVAPPLQQQQQQQPMLLGLDGPIKSFVKIQILALLDILANIIMDFTAGNVSRSGWIVTAAFFCFVLAFITLLLIIVFINLDLSENRGPFQNLYNSMPTSSAFFMFFFFFLNFCMMRLYAFVNNVNL
jgi:hypothetical protein